MSTPNFALKNASRFFVLGMPVYYTQEDIDECELDQDLLDHFDETGTEANYEADKANVAGELKAKGWHDIEVRDYDYNDLTADDVIRDDWYNNKGLSKIHAAHIIRKIESIIDELKNEAEMAFSKYSDEEMYCAYRCSNGEAGYGRTDKRLWQEVEEQKKKTA